MILTTPPLFHNIPDVRPDVDVGKTILVVPYSLVKVVEELPITVVLAPSPDVPAPMVMLFTPLPELVAGEAPYPITMQLLSFSSHPLAKDPM